MSQIDQTETEVFLAFQVIPRVREGRNFEVVDRAIDVVKKAGIPFQVGAMETTMKGELDHLLQVVKDAQQACLDHGAVEVITTSKFTRQRLMRMTRFAHTIGGSRQVTVFSLKMRNARKADQPLL